MATTLSAPAAEGKERVRLAIGGFSKPGDPSWNAEQNEKICALLTAALSGQERFDLVERSEIKRALDEITLAQWNTEKAGRLGQVLRADWLVVGSLARKQDELSLAVRIVDAQLGVVRDLTCLPYLETEPERAADQVAKFIVASPDQVTLAGRVYLGLGTLEDQGVNDRSLNAKVEFRRALEEAFRGTKVAIVERQMVNPLLRELRLGLGGLSAEAPAAKTSEPAFFVADGLYQGFQDDQFKINLLLRVRRIGGQEQNLSFTERLGPPLFSKVVAALREVIEKSAGPGQPASRAEEAQWQIERGKERARLPMELFGDALGGYGSRDPNPRRRQNILEAIDAFESALFLQPDQAEAKLFLAACLLDETEKFRREAEARDYLMEAINSSDPKVVSAAKRKLAESYEPTDNKRALQLYRQFGGAATNKAERWGFFFDALRPAEKVAAENKITLDEHRQLLQEALRFQYDHVEELVQAQGAGKKFFAPYVPGQFQNIFTYTLRAHGFDGDAAAAFLDQTLPPIIDEHPKMALALWSSYAAWRGWNCKKPSEVTETRVLQLLQAYQQESNQVLCPDLFNASFLQPMMEWSRAGQTPTRQKISEICHSIRLGQRPAPVVVVDGRTNRMSGLGTNVTRISPFWPGELTPSFELGAPVFRGVNNLKVTVDGSQLWIIDGWLPELFDKATGTSTDVSWPVEVERITTSIAAGPDRVWFGTAGSGLVEWDKRTRQFRIYRMADGLILDDISSLCLAGERLWIGYGQRNVGGLGYLETKSGRFVGLTPELKSSDFKSHLPDREAAVNGPPKNYVVGLVQPSTNDLFVLARNTGIQRYQLAENKWTTLGSYLDRLNFFTALAGNERYLVHSAAGSYGGFCFSDFPSGKERPATFDVMSWLKPTPERRRNNSVFALATDGERAWLGGVGFIALVNPSTGKLEKICDLGKTDEIVRSLIVDGDDVWATINKCLYRLSRKTLLAPSPQQARR